MTRFPLFFTTSLLAILVMIGLALAPILPNKPAAIEAKAEGSALVFDAKALNRLVESKGFPVTAAPGPRGDQTGPRLATASVLGPTAINSKGARLIFGPQTRDVLGNGALRARLIIKPISNNPSNKIAVAIVRDGPVEWVQARLDPTQSVVELTFPANAKPATALAIWPAAEGQGHGIELQSIAFFRAQLEYSQ
jgi:hypothetical protein